MNSFSLFTDVSVNPRLKLGVGAYLFVPSSILSLPPDRIKKAEVIERLVFNTFERASSTTLEVQTVLWALEDYRKKSKASGPEKLRVYSDSQCVAGLLKRRPQLELNGFLSKRKNRLLKNAFLYRKFYECYDETGFKVIKVAGHVRSNAHDTIQLIFSFVDKEARKALKLWISESEPKYVEPHYP